jgi:UDP:flavonoid glycosyltransferase YjiC (YdhE family)
MDNKRMTPHRIIIGTFGTFGEVQPAFAVASALRERGHEIVVLAPAVYEKSARALGFDFAPICSAEWHDAFIGQKLLWHPDFGYPLLARGIAEMVEPMYEAVVAHHQPGRTVLVLSWMFLGGRVARDALQIPTVTLHPYPAIFRDRAEPPVIPPLPLAKNAPRWNGAWFRAVDLMMDHLLARAVNRLRTRLGLPRVTRLMHEWIHSPDCVIGLFPEWFAPIQRDWPKQTVLTGFPLYDAGNETPLSPGLVDFLESGSPPLVFFRGTGIRHAAKFFDAAIEICRTSGRRGVLLSSFAENFKAALPLFIHTEAYAPFSLLLPRAAAFFHHGGIGSTGQALAAGTPQVVFPSAFDQSDNAARIERLGTGVVIAPRKFNARTGAAALERVLGDDFARACAEVKARFAYAQTPRHAADRVERVFAERRAAA